MYVRVPRLATHVLLILTLAACGGGDSPTLISGSVGGLIVGRGVVLQNNGADSTTVTSDGPFYFPTQLARGTPYNVSVRTQPDGQMCSVARGSGTAGAATVEVAVSCVLLPDSWTWTGGSNTAGAHGVYGTLGDPTGGTVPSARFAAVSWTDSSGVVWLFGGQGRDSAGNEGVLNDLWRYSEGQWIWEGGSDTIGARGSYGTRGVAAADNVPGARYAAVTWTDSSGNVWLFGGQGVDSTGKEGVLNDLWKYSAGQWIWVGGSNSINAKGSYGTTGTAAASNVPGARLASNSWIDSSGNFWLFGGLGFDAAGNQGFLNDLWKYSSGQWTWVSGAQAVNIPGSYGTSGVAAAGNVPGSRLRAISWVDASGALWFFGGLGFDAAGNQGSLNDLWKYSSGAWSWMGGSDTINARGSPGMRGAAAAGNVPGARYAANSWMDSSGSVWLFGGVGTDSSGNQFGMNDLWKYRDGQWTWASGSSAINASGAYGTQGLAATANAPGARYAASSWMDSSDHLWLFGGQGLDSTANPGLLNDLWEYAP